MADDLATMLNKARAAGLSYLSVDVARNQVRVTAWNRAPARRTISAYGEDIETTIMDAVAQVFGGPKSVPEKDLFGDL